MAAPDDKIVNRHVNIPCPSGKHQHSLVTFRNRLPRTLVFWCSARDHRWSADEPGTPKQLNLEKATNTRWKATAS